jgi:septum formation protein
MSPPGSGRVVLASASPRRRMLLEAAGLPVEVRPAHVDESRVAGCAPVAHALGLARKKALAVPADGLVVAADTVVHLGDDIFEKPAHRDEARAHLRALSGREHAVTTGVCVRRGSVEDAFTVTTRVRFRALTDDDIARYLATGEADDKAGAYGIQGLGMVLVAEVHGDFTNVVGLPVAATLAAIGRLR